MPMRYPVPAGRAAQPAARSRPAARRGGALAAGTSRKPGIGSPDRMPIPARERRPGGTRRRVSRVAHCQNNPVSRRALINPDAAAGTAHDPLSARRGGLSVTSAARASRPSPRLRCSAWGLSLPARRRRRSWRGAPRGRGPPRHEGYPRLAEGMVRMPRRELFGREVASIGHSRRPRL